MIRRRATAWWAFALVVVLVAHASSVLGGFVWDDLSLIVEERLVTGPHRLMDHFSRLFWSGPLNAHEGFYRPLISLSYAADYRLWNGQPAGFHLTNLALHLACTSLVWALCRRASPDAHPAVLAALAMGFGLMPRLTESVAWISGRTDLAAGVGALSTFLLYRPGPGAWGRKVAASLMLLAGLLCKEVAIAGLVAVLILELRHRKATGDRLSNVLGHLAPAMAAMVVYGLLRAHAGAVDTTAIERDPGWHTRGKVAATFLEAIGRYPLMMIDVFRPRLLIGTVGRPSLPIVALGAALVVLLVWGLVRLVRSPASPRMNDTQLAALGFAATALGLVLHLLPHALPVVAADRFLYFPVAALIIAAAPIAERFGVVRHRIATYAAFALLGALAIATTLRTVEWTDELQLWRQTVRTAPEGNPLAHLGLGGALIRRGRWQDALEIFEQLGRRQPELVEEPVVRGNVALCLDKLGRHADAITILERTLAENPHQLRARYNLVMANARNLQFDAARRQAGELRRLFPRDEHVFDLIRAVDAAERDLAALPAERQDEPVARRAQRAAVYSSLAAPSDAGARWALVAVDLGAAATLRAQALSYLVSQADIRLAQRVLDTVSRNPPAGVDRDSLDSVLAERLDAR